MLCVCLVGPENRHPPVLANDYRSQLVKVRQLHVVSLLGDGRRQIYIHTVALAIVRVLWSNWRVSISNVRCSDLYRWRIDFVQGRDAKAEVPIRLGGIGARLLCSTARLV